MADVDFPKCMTRVLAYEGGYSNHPKDPGGVTLEGVIQRVYDGYRKRKGRPLRALTPSMRGTADWIAERNEIYRLQYWDKVRGAELPAGVDLAVFDGAVNSGPVQAIKWLQRALGMNTVDGMLGEATMARVDAHPDHDQLVADICARRLAMLRQLSTWKTFGPGWGARVSNVVATGQAWATGSVGPAPVAAHEDGGQAKAYVQDVAEAPVSVGMGASGATAGTVTYGALDQLQSASAQLQPVADTIHIVKWVVIGITLIVAGVTLYGIYRSWKAQRAREGMDAVTVPEEE